MTGQPSVANATNTSARRRSWPKKLALLLGATAFGFLLCETGARLVLPAPPYPWHSPEIVYATDPELGFLHGANQRGWIDDGFVTINQLGFRGRELVEPKPKDQFRIVVLGDSVALGWGVHDDATFPAQLETLLRDRFPDKNVEVVNCAVSGYDTGQEAALYKRFTQRLEPDLVLVALYWNDVLSTATVADKHAAPSELGTQVDVAHDAQPRTLRMSKPFRWTEYLVMQSRALYCAGRTVRWLLTKPGERDAGQFATEQAILEGVDNQVTTRGWANVEAGLARIRATARSQNAQVGIVVIPCKEQVGRACPNAKYQSVAKEIGRQHGLFVIDPLPAYRERRSTIANMFIPYDRHHQTSVGLHVTAAVTADYLAKHEHLTP